ncbi:MAG: hypothetical protein ACOYON_13080 [Fimbriimonas sp.]
MMLARKVTNPGIFIGRVAKPATATPTTDWNWPVRLMMILPLAFLLGITVHSRMHVETYEMPEYSMAENDAIAAYRGVVARSQALSGASAGDAAKVEAVAREWIYGAAKGDLKALQTSDYFDNASEGVKAEINQARHQVVNRLHNLATVEIANGEFESAAKHYLLVTQLAEVTKYFDLGTVYNSGADQRTALGNLAILLPKLNSKQAEAIRSGLEEVRNQQQPLDGLTARMRRHFAAYRREQGKEPLAIEDAQRVNMFAQVATSSQDPSLVARDLRKINLTSTGGELPTMLSETRTAYISQAQLMKFFRELLGDPAK